MYQLIGIIGVFLGIGIRSVKNAQMRVITGPIPILLKQI